MLTPKTAPHLRHVAALTALALSLSACSVPKPTAYQATAPQVAQAIAQVTPTLSKKLLNEPWRVVSQTPDRITVATKLPGGAKVAQFLLTGSVNLGNSEAQIQFNLKQAGNVTYVSHTIEGEPDLQSRAQEVYAFLDKRFTRVQVR